MNQSIEDRMDSIEQQLKELRKEMEESIARYKAVDDVGKSYPFTHGDVNKFRSGQIGDIPETSYDFPEFKLWGMEKKCLWESIPVEDRMKPMSLSCPCRKCSAYC